MFGVVARLLCSPGRGFDSFDNVLVISTFPNLIEVDLCCSASTGTGALEAVLAATSFEIGERLRLRYLSRLLGGVGGCDRGRPGCYLLVILGRGSALEGARWSCSKYSIPLGGFQVASGSVDFAEFEGFWGNRTYRYRCTVSAGVVVSWFRCRFWEFSNC